MRQKTDRVLSTVGRSGTSGGIEPTNHAAERAWRLAVIWGRISLGTQSTEGSQFVARRMTVGLTLCAPQRHVLAYLTTAGQAARPCLPPRCCQTALCGKKNIICLSLLKTPVNGYNFSNRLVALYRLP